MTLRFQRYFPANQQRFYPCQKYLQQNKIFYSLVVLGRLLVFKGLLSVSYFNIIKISLHNLIYVIKLKPRVHFWIRLITNKEFYRWFFIAYQILLLTKLLELWSYIDKIVTPISIRYAWKSLPILAFTSLLVIQQTTSKVISLRVYHKQNRLKTTGWFMC